MLWTLFAHQIAKHFKASPFLSTLNAQAESLHQPCSSIQADGAATELNWRETLPHHPNATFLLPVVLGFHWHPEAQVGQAGQEVLVGPTTRKDMNINDIAHSQSETNEEFCDFLNKLCKITTETKLANKTQVIRLGRSDLRPGLPCVYWSSWSSLEAKVFKIRAGSCVCTNRIYGKFWS